MSNPKLPFSKSLITLRRLAIEPTANRPARASSVNSTVSALASPERGRHRGGETWTTGIGKVGPPGGGGTHCAGASGGGGGGGAPSGGGGGELGGPYDGAGAAGRGGSEAAVGSWGGQEPGRPPSS